MSKQVTLISVEEWDNLVVKTYGKIYSFQQQNNCRDRGIYHLCIPSCDAEDFKNTELPEIVNHPKRGIKFSAWLDRDPNQPLKKLSDQGDTVYPWEIVIWWERNFYPNVEFLANDLHQKGLLAAGDYIIEIDW